jgi:hypothetical protein
MVRQITIEAETPGDARTVVIRRWMEWVVEDGKWWSEMVLETGLETGTDAPGYDSTALEN